MEDRGLQDDPRYSQLLAMRAKQNPGGPGMAPPSPGPPMDPNRLDIISTNAFYGYKRFYFIKNLIDLELDY